MRYLLTGGGTAGHINPALAIAETIRNNDFDAVIEFVGVRGRREEELVPRAGYKLHFVTSGGFSGKLPTPGNLRAAWLALTSPYAKETLKIINDFAPDIVIGTGGYASWPIMSAAARLGIPTAVHESNSYPGKTVRRLARSVDRIWTNFPGTAEHLRQSEKVIHVGNPLRGGFTAYTKADARQELGIPEGCLFILSYGGSQGARSINAGVVDMMKSYSSHHAHIFHMHAAGKLCYPETRDAFRSAGLREDGNCRLTEYIYDMPRCMAAADLVICRAGAMSVSELAQLQKPCVLVPYPHAAYNHQYLNAKELADAGAAVLLPDSEVSLPGTLHRAVEKILSEPVHMIEMQRSIAAFADADANRRIWEDIQLLLQTNQDNKKNQQKERQRKRS